jgi:Sensors of blue-light using FAD
MCANVQSATSIASILRWMSSLIHVIYASAAGAGFDESDLDEILRRARTANEAVAVTGMLLYSQGSFFQVLEGEADAVDKVYARILRDARHTRVAVIIREAIARRSFAEWTMGYADIAPAEVADIAGLNDFFGPGSCFEGLDDGRAKKLLAAFADGRWRVRLGGAVPPPTPGTYK